MNRSDKIKSLHSAQPEFSFFFSTIPFLHRTTSKMTSTSGIAVLLIDPYNDFIHPEGKWYGNVKESLEATETVKYMRRLIQAARAAHIPIYYCLHQQYKPGNYDGWNRMTSYHIGMKEGRVIEEGSWGAQIYEGMEPDLANGDVVVSKHWNARWVEPSLLTLAKEQLADTEVFTVHFRIPTWTTYCINATSLN